MKKLFTFLFVFLFMQCSFAEESEMTLRHVGVDLKDVPSLQRGAKYFMNYCAACHSLKYVRYNQMAKDIGLVNDEDEVNDKLLKANLIFTNSKVGDPITNALSESDGKKWFGVSPPDLSLEARVRGADWLFTYLTSFYHDDKRVWGSNNRLFPDVAMPNVLMNLQGIRIPIYREEIIPYDGSKKKIQVIDHLEQVEEGSMSEHQFDAMAKDIVNFLVFVSEPVKLERERLGLFVLLFLVILAVLAYFLKKDYWKDVK